MIKNKIVYIIPTYNEKENIVEMLETVSGVLKKLKDHESQILVVDDNSPDGTSELVRIYQNKNRSIKLLTGEKKGLGSAIIRGYKFAIKKLKANIIITNEADFSYSPAEAIPMINKIKNGADAVFGSRKLTNTKKWSPTRKIIHWTANTLFANLIAGIVEIDDHNSAFKAIRAEVLKKIDFDNFPHGFAFFNYLTFKITQTTPNLVEFYTTYTPRTKGASKISLSQKYFKYFFKDTWEYILICFKIRVERTFK